MSRNLTKKPIIAVKEISDVYARNNFKALDDYFTDQNQFLDFKFFEVIVSAADDEIRVAHGLNRIPRDINRLQFSGSGNLTIKRSQFTSTEMVFSASGPCVARFFAGSYFNNNPGENLADSDDEVWTSTVSSVTLTSWEDFTPSGSWVNGVTYTGKKRRIGDSLDLDITIAIKEAPNSANLTINLPDSLEIDTDKLSDDVALKVLEGGVIIGDSSASDQYSGVVAYVSTTAIGVYKDDGDGTLSPVTITAPITFASGDKVFIRLSGLPIVGW